MQGLAAAGDCRAGAGRWSARRARRARRSGRCRSGWPGGCAAIRRRKASASAGSASDNRGRHRPGTAGGCVISRSSSPATCCCVLRQLQVLEERQRLRQRPVARCRRGCGPGNGTAAASSRSREPWQVGAGHLADQVIELLAIDEADARRLVDGREEALVLEAHEPERPASVRLFCRFAARSASAQSTLRPCRAGRPAAAPGPAAQTAYPARSRRAGPAPRQSA